MSRHFLNRVRGISTPILLIAFLMLFIVVIGEIGDKSLARTATELLIRVTLVVSLWIFVGNSGVVSFGHAGYMVIGAYASAWLTIKPAMKAVLLHGLPLWLAQAEWHVFPAILAAGALSAVVALVSGSAILRPVQPLR
jgi:branched-chain amino acid transport system permease protein